MMAALRILRSPTSILVSPSEQSSKEKEVEDVGSLDGTGDFSFTTLLLLPSGK